MEKITPIWEEYIKINMLGNSAYGTVYKAKSKEKKIVSIKEYVKYQKEAYEIYNNEIKYVNELKSNNIINYIKTLNTEEYFYIIRDYYYGTLEEFVKVHNQQVSLKEIQMILKDLSNAFKLLNEKNLVHRDIKPSNILLSLNGKNGYKAILSGIHLIKIYNEKDISSLRAIRYICPPEGLKGESIDMKYDLWSVGILIYFMIKGKYPFNGSTDVLVLTQIEKGVNLDISSDNDLNDLLKKTLQKNVNQRISWNEFFNHPFLNKQILDIYTETEDMKKNKTDFIEKKKDFTNKIKNYRSEIKNYSTMIQKYQPEYLQTFDDKIRDKLLDTSKIFEYFYTTLN